MTKRRKGLREVLSIALLLCLLLTQGMTALADSGTAIEASFTEGFDLSSTAWMQSGVSRALLTISLGIDLSQAVDESEFAIANALFNGKSLVGRISESGVLGVYLHGTNQDYLIVYSPSSGEAGYTTNEVMDDSLAMTKFGLIFDQNYFNDDADIATVLDTMQEVWGD